MLQALRGHGHLTVRVEGGVSPLHGPPADDYTVVIASPYNDTQSDAASG